VIVQVKRPNLPFYLLCEQVQDGAALRQSLTLVH